MRLILASITLAAGSAALVASAPEPAPRSLTATALSMAKRPAHITAVRELADGSVLISDITTPAVLRLDPASGATQPVGSAGAGADQYAQPGGFYDGPGGTTLLADHSGPRVLVISAEGRI